MGNSGEQKFRALLEDLTADDDEVVAKTAAWALGKLRSRD
jgi:HEAT repeat protein